MPSRAPSRPIYAVATGLDISAGLTLIGVSAITFSNNPGYTNAFKAAVCSGFNGNIEPSDINITSILTASSSPTSTRSRVMIASELNSTRVSFKVLVIIEKFGYTESNAFNSLTAILDNSITSQNFGDRMNSELVANSFAPITVSEFIASAEDSNFIHATTVMPSSAPTSDTKTLTSSFLRISKSMTFKYLFIYFLICFCVLDLLVQLCLGTAVFLLLLYLLYTCLRNHYAAVDHRKVYLEPAHAAFEMRPTRKLDTRDLRVKRHSEVRI